MVHKYAEPLPQLYESDETAWLDTMAELIHAGRLADLDYPHLAEYLEDMARRDRREVASRLKVLLTHILKWIYQQQKRSASWQVTVLDQQDELDDLLESGVLRAHAEQSLSATYQKAVKRASVETKIPFRTFPVECPWTLDQLLSAKLLDK